MKNFFISIFKALFRQTPDAWYDAKIIRVSDGDTVEVSIGAEVKRVRLFGIDAPERSQVFGEEARGFLYELVKKQDGFVRVVPKAVDKYQRQVAVIFTKEGRNINEALLASGLAFYDDYGDRLNPTDKHRRVLRAAYQEAKRERLGVFGSEVPMQTPYEYRRIMRSKR